MIEETKMTENPEVEHSPEKAASLDTHAPKKVAATWERVDSLVPWFKNPRKNQPIGKVAKSIAKNGWGAPIVARTESREIIAGHTRWFAAQKLGLDEAPVRFVEVTDEQARDLALADNRLGEDAEWDMPKLALILDEMEFEDIADVGFSDEDLNEVIRFADEELGGDTDPGEESENDEGNIETGFAIVINCRDENQQKEIIEFAVAEGWDVRALT